MGASTERLRSSGTPYRRQDEGQVFEQSARVAPGFDSVDVSMIRSRGESSDSPADQVAAALRTTSAAVLVICRPGDHRIADDEWLIRAIGVRFSTVPDLVAIGLVPDEDGTGTHFALLGDRMDRSSRTIWPAALAVRVTDTAQALISLRNGNDDPLVELAERLRATRARFEWRLHPSDAVPLPSWTGHNRFDLTFRTDATPAPVRPVTQPAAHLHDWVIVVRRLREDGSRRITTEGEPFEAGERLERPLFLARPGPYNGGVAVTGGSYGLTEYRPHPDEVAPAVAYLDRGPVLGSVSVVVWHDPGPARDHVGLADESPRGCHVSRVLGWGRELPAAQTGEAPAPPPVDRAVLYRRGTWVVEPVVTGEMRQEYRDALGLIHGSPRPGFRRLCAARRRGVDVLTIDPFEPELDGLRHLGWIPPAATEDAPIVLRRRRDGRVETERSTISQDHDGGLVLGALEPPPGLRDEVIALPPPSRPAVPRVGLHRRVRRRVGRVVRANPTGPPSTLVVAPWFSVGGGDHFLLSLARMLRAEGFPLRAALTFDRASSPVDNRAAFRPHFESIVCLPEERPGVPPVQAVAEMIRDHRIEQLLLCGGFQLYSGLPALRAAYPDLRIVDQLFNTVGHIANNTRYHESIDLTICAYRALRSILVERQGRRPERVALAYIGIDTDHFSFAAGQARRDAKRALGFDPDRDLWGYLGRISSEKCLPDFVAAVERIQGLHTAQLLIQGEGPGRAELETALAASSGVPIELRPFADDVRPTLRALDAYVLPSRIEGIPLGVMEAMASGALPVSTPVGGLPELVKPGENGYLAAPGDPGALSVGLLSLARTGPESRDAMARFSSPRASSRATSRWRNDSP
jgi:glycosyltransferase involved in cell wall biosynthesis